MNCKLHFSTDVQIDKVKMLLMSDNYFYQPYEDIPINHCLSIQRQLGPYHFGEQDLINNPKGQKES